MNKRGEMNMVGVIVVIAITLIVGAILFQVIQQEVGLSTSTRTVANESVTGTLVNDTALYITSYRSISGVTIFNATNDLAVGSGNYTIATNVIDPTTGGLAISVTPTVSATPVLGYLEGTWTIDGTAQETDYIDNAGARAMASLIGIFFALALAVIALTPVLREKLLASFGR